MAVAYPCDRESLLGVAHAVADRLIVPLLVGPASKIRELAALEGMEPACFALVDGPDDPGLCTRKAAELVSEGAADALMQGNVAASQFLKAVLGRDAGLRRQQRMSHVFIFEVPTYPRLLLITDAVINMKPGSKEKWEILRNAVELAHILGDKNPRVSVLSAAAHPSPEIPSSIDAGELVRMAAADKNADAVIEGPVRLEDVLSRACTKKMAGAPETGRYIDILLVPNMEAGIMLAKGLQYLAGAKAAGMVLGGKAPIVLTGRSDSAEMRAMSSAVASLMCRSEARGDKTETSMRLSSPKAIDGGWSDIM